jgi:WD repeat-containing protein 19
VLVHNGVVWCQAASGQLANIVAVTHDQLDQSNSARGQPDTQKLVFAQTLALLRLEKAWKFAQMMNAVPYWKALAGKAMEQLNIEMAIKVYRELGDAGMVMGLEAIMHIEDKNLLAGHVALLFGEYAQAQELFLMSTKPTAALEMRRDLLHWDQALKLARTLAEDQVPDISVSFAQQLEQRGEYEAALHMYESACNGNDGDSKMPEDSSDTLCIAGIAKTSLRLGDIRRGTRLAINSKDRQLCKECGDILKSMSQWQDAATVYEEGERYEDAVKIYLSKMLNATKMEPLMDKINAPRLLKEYAILKQKEAEKETDTRVKTKLFEKASDAFHRAKELDFVVKLQLNHLNNPEVAFGIVRQTGSSEGAMLVAEYCKKMSDYGGAIEFLLMAQKSEEAFQLAQTHDQMAVYAKALGDTITQEEATDIARYYEQQQNWGKAGEFYTVCGKYKVALKLFLQCGEREMDKAIDVVGKAKSDTLTHTLIDFLMGETDGVPKDPNFIFRLYMALGNYNQAAKTAIIIARQEQELGNYKVAHSTLYETQMELENNQINVPRALRSSLLLLHSYMLIKKLVKMGDHLGASRMLIRVSKNISKFPSHIVQILTSTVIECLRAEMRASAYEYASMLMRPEYRSKIDPKFKRKIEGIVRRPNRDPEEEELSPCPYTGKPIPVTDLVCPDTKNDIPFCVVTGQHMVLDDWCICPNSRMPALYSKYLKYLETEKTDPVCGKPIDERMLEKIMDPAPLLERYNSTGNSKKKEKTDEGVSDQ